MIIENKAFCLFGKPVLNKISIQPPFETLTQMNNEACFLYVLEGEQTTISASEKVTAKKGESILEKCGNYLNKVNLVQEKTLTEYIIIHFFPETIKGVFNLKNSPMLASGSIKRCFEKTHYPKKSGFRSFRSEKFWRMPRLACLGVVKI